MLVNPTIAENLTANRKIYLFLFCNNDLLMSPTCWIFLIDKCKLLLIGR